MVIIDNLTQWQEWNKQGLIPGIQETQEEFEKRANFCLSLENYLKNEEQVEFPFQFESNSKKILENAFSFTEDLYGISPSWTPLFFSNYRLQPWQGGCTWIFKLNENTPTSAFLQLRAHFHSFQTYLGLYDRKELIAHELAHVGRMTYEEPVFEEILAYQSSSSYFRRWLGPLIQSSKESLFFVILLSLVIFSDLLSIYFYPFFTSSLLLMIKFLPILFLGLGLGRLGYRHYVFKKCLKNLYAIYANKQAQHMIYRLSDHEINQFAFSSPDKIKKFINESAILSFRWHFLSVIYPIPSI